MASTGVWTLAVASALGGWVLTRCLRSRTPRVARPAPFPAPRLVTEATLQPAHRMSGLFPESYRADPPRPTRPNTDERRRAFLEAELDRAALSEGEARASHAARIAREIARARLGESLPKLLRLAPDVMRSVHGDGFAADLVCMPDFQPLLIEPLSPVGQAALGVLVRALQADAQAAPGSETLPPAVVAERLSALARFCPETTDPWTARALTEAVRWVRRHRSVFGPCPDESEAAPRLEQLHDLEPTFREYLHDIGPELVRRLVGADLPTRRAILETIRLLRADGGPDLIDLARRGPAELRPLALRCLEHVRDPEAGWLILDKLEPASALFRRRGHLAERVAALEALRGHPSTAAEHVLLRHAQSGDAAVRVAALDSFGWWEPIRRTPMLDLLAKLERSPDPATARSAWAASARLGRRGAIDRLGHELRSTDLAVAGPACELVVSSRLSWLWPDLSELLETCPDDAPSRAALLRLTIERLRQQILGLLG